MALASLALLDFLVDLALLVLSFFDLFGFLFSPSIFTFLVLYWFLSLFQDSNYILAYNSTYVNILLMLYVTVSGPNRSKNGFRTFIITNKVMLPTIINTQSWLLRGPTTKYVAINGT